jgi:hypothetical protein
MLRRSLRARGRRRAPPDPTGRPARHRPPRGLPGGVGGDPPDCVPTRPLAVPGCGRGGALEVHHIVKRAQGGSDFDLDRLVALCPPCHARTDAAYARGRLVITPLGAGRVTIEVMRGADKWAVGTHTTVIAGTCPESATQPAVSREP